MRNGLAISALFLCALLSGCNSSSNNDGRNVSGTWSGALTKSVDNCVGSTAPQTINFVHTVNQQDEAVTLSSNDGLTYLGNTLSNRGFSVDASGTPQTINGVLCSSANRIEYDNIDSDDDTTAGVDIRTMRICGTAECEISYTGTASRTVATSTPVPGTTPVAGGCPAINPNPAAGTYAEDGGCGLSTAGYSIQGSSVILEPFGGNGATSFMINSLNNSQAISARQDLTILGEAGFSCSLTCSAPSTFTVSCFKEGATTSVEKF